MDFIKRIDQLILDAEDLLKTKYEDDRHDIPLAAGIKSIYKVKCVDAKKYFCWRTDLSLFMNNIFSEDNSLHPLHIQYNKNVIEDNLCSCVERGIEILKIIKKNIQNDTLHMKVKNQSLSIVENIFEKFHVIARKMRKRHNNRSTIDVKDEYDVQDLIHCLLLINFDDIRAEEWTPSYAGKSARMDFLLKEENIVLEIKKSRSGLTHKELGDELIVDIDRYKSHPNCKTLICFVYDPDGYISNPIGIEKDLSREEPIQVKVFIRPR